MSKRWKISIGIIAGLVVVLVITWTSPLGRFLLTGGFSKLKEQPFESQQWKAVRNDSAALHVRLMMLDDLMENKLTIGMDSLFVKEMLGEPERQYGFSYSLGALAEGIDPLYLVLDFDSAGRMSKLNVANEGKLKNDPRMLKLEIKK